MTLKTKWWLQSRVSYRVSFRRLYALLGNFHYNFLIVDNTLSQCTVEPIFSLHTTFTLEILKGAIFAIRLKLEIKIQ